MHLFCKRYEIRFDLSAEILHLFSSVRIAVHPVISEFYIILISEESCLCRTIFHQFIIDLIQLFCFTLEKRAVLFMRSASDLSILMCHIRTQQGQIQCLTIPVNLRTRDQIVIPGCQCIFFLHQRNELLVHGLEFKLHTLKCHFSDLLFQFCFVWRIIKYFSVFSLLIADRRQYFIIIVLLFTVECISSIYITANHRNLNHRAVLVTQLIKLLMNRKLLFSALCSLQFLCQLFEPCHNGICINPLIRHLCKLHSLSSLFYLSAFALLYFFSFLVIINHRAKVLLL